MSTAKLFMSACRSDVSAIANHENTMALATYLARHDYKFDVCLGVYEEDNHTVSTEVSFCVTTHGEFHSISDIAAVATAWAEEVSGSYQQECIGVLMGDRFYLAYPLGGFEFVGIWTQFDERPNGNATQLHGKWYSAVK